MKRLIFLYFLLLKTSVFGNDTLNFFKPYLLSNHPLGVFTSRINHNYNYKPSQYIVEFTISRGNVWLPNVESKLPNLKSDRDFLSNYVWHDRNWQMESLNVSDYNSRLMYCDGVLSTYYLSFKSPLSKLFDFFTNIRSTSLDGGNTPYSLLTNDKAIEWFHSNIAGGNDAFGRNRTEYGNALLSYKDVNNNEITLKNRSFLMSEISSYLNYYPKLNYKNIFFNLSSLTSISQIKKTWHFDVGILGSAVKKFKWNKNYIDWGVSSGILFPSIFQTQKVIINNTNRLFSAETHFNLRIPKKKNNAYILGVNIHMQSNFHSMKERKYNVIYREDVTSHDHHGVSHLTRWTSGCTVIVGYDWKKTSINAFFREDFWVDNAPDVQVGWGIQRKF
ncbi:MAG: hypothetical protein CMD18_03415 [Flavobacteriales bacterium]|nr:hypothetical protein [Flavobacteriales bacterium]